NVTITVVDSALQITRISSVSYASNTLRSVDTYDLTDSYVLLEVVESGDLSVSTTAAHLVAEAGFPAIAIERTDTLLGLTAFSLDQGYDGTSFPYSASDHRWWRISHDSGTGQILFDTSPDGATWTNRFSTPTPAGIEELIFKL